MTSIRVFLVDDHEVVRRGLADLIGSTDDIEVVGEASTAAEAMRRLPAAKPDVILLDMQLPDGTGVEICRDIKEDLPDAACLVLTSFDDDEALFAAIMAGAAGYLLKQVRGTDLLEAVRRVAKGQSLLDPGVTQRVLERLRNPPVSDARLSSLTEQERRVLDLVAQGMTNRQVGTQLSLAEKTIKNHVSGLLSKLGLQSRTQAALYLAENR